MPKKITKQSFTILGMGCLKLVSMEMLTKGNLNILDLNPKTSLDFLFQASVSSSALETFVLLETE